MKNDAPRNHAITRLEAASRSKPTGIQHISVRAYSAIIAAFTSMLKNRRAPLFRSLDWPRRPWSPAIVGGRASRIDDPCGSLKYRAGAASFRYSWPWGRRDEANSRSMRRGTGRGRVEGGRESALSFYYIVSGRGEADAAIVYARVPPYWTHRMHSRIPTTCTRGERADDPGERASLCPLPSSPTPVPTAERSSSLFLRSG